MTWTFEAGLTDALPLRYLKGAHRPGIHIKPGLLRMRRTRPTLIEVIMTTDRLAQRWVRRVPRLRDGTKAQLPGTMASIAASAHVVVSESLDAGNTVERHPAADDSARGQKILGLDA
jgi:hypothetical protein